MPKVTIIVPTLNEEANIDLLLQRIFQVRRSCQMEFDVLFVDSASKDRTCERVRAWQDREPVRLLSRDTNVGLAGAVIAGAGITDAPFVVVMDADLSHPPEAIPDLLRPLLAGTHDMIIGSRYVAGGSMPDWPLSRKLSSRLATFPALFFCDVQDPLAGFFALQRRWLVELPGPVPGFKIGLAVLAEYGRDMRVKEIPIEFRERDCGESKMDRRVALEYLQQLVDLTVQRLRRRRRKG
ncbi:MAG: polyprenol monophosphomannose synthase [Proteobacteria bacterium]|nr:polyprenol monophosphomannose synthase [Pseudomonadota bacterium]